MSAKDHDLTVEVVQIKNDPGDETQTSYRARLIPEQKLMEDKTWDERNALSYRMDSCFYIDGAKGRKYAALVQAVANGQKDSYEYLLEFEKDKEGNTGPENMVYRDKYLNGKTRATNVD